MISVRLTTEEYSSFRELCFAHGIRTLSEMARTAMQMMHQQSSSQRPPDPVEARIAQLEGRLESLSLEVQRLGRS